MDDGWTWDASLFSGAAPYYDRGRPPYADGLAAALADALALDGSGRLLDVGCGPGTVALLLAHHYGEVVGLDPDPGMVTEASRLAAERGVGNARWVQGRAEELPAGLGSFRTVTFAASFHWMDRPVVARAVRRMLEPGGVIVHVDNHHQAGLAPARDVAHPPPPEDAIADLRRSHLGAERRAGQGIRTSSPSDEDGVFRAAGFVGPDRFIVTDGRILDRTADDVVAHVFSTSSTAPHLFGDRVAGFERQLRAALAEASPSGRFTIQLPDNELKIWRPTVP